jgi:periplasmic divalent cation tolerance protein
MSAKRKFLLIICTTANFKEAKSLARYLVDKKLAACVNIIANIISLYTWEKKVQQSREALLIIKTKRSLFKKISSLIKVRHSYQVPEIIAVEISRGEKQYLDWLASACR